MIHFEAPEKRLLRLLREHAGQYTIDDDGVVATDFNHPEVRRRMMALGESVDRLFADQISGDKMKKLIVTINHLEECTDGIAHGTSVTFKVMQAGGLLVEDALSGKLTQPYSKSYEVEATDDAIAVEHNRADLPELRITAILDSHSPVQ